VRFFDDLHVDGSTRRAEATLFVCHDSDYLADHFPGAPMLPGLMMLELAVQGAAALWGACEGHEPFFAAELEHLDRLRVTRRVVPGETLSVQVDMQPSDASDKASFKAVGKVNGLATMRASFRLRRLSGLDDARFEQ
jgi:3-hydroxyacyl-[acyl-carrier-protein] dehydratase